jgi:hypothetical protein
MIREACLWHHLTNEGTKNSSTTWWKYKREYLEHCTTAQNKFGAQCSEDLVKGLNLPEDQFKKWKACWEPYGSADKNIAVADKEIADMGAEKEHWYNKLAIEINSVHYHGLFDKVRAALQLMCPLIGNSTVLS